MKFLVTGSSGHLGEALMRTLRDGHRSALGIDVLPGAYTDRCGSIADRGFVEDCIGGVDVVLHAATLHKPHVGTHSKTDFVDTNIRGTLNLLECAVSARVGAFVFTSTTSTFGHAMAPSETDPAVWVTEALTPVPRNIYGVTKTAAEDVCQLIHQEHGLPCLILRTSRFFPEDDDQKTVRDAFSNDNAKANEFLYRRVEIEDVVSAHLLAAERAAEIGFGRYIISATTPFTRADLAELNRNAPAVVERLFPDYAAEYARRGWRMFPRIGRVYSNERALTELGWRPRHDFRTVLDALKRGVDPRSALARAIGAKGYHADTFEGDAPYPLGTHAT